MLRLEAINTNKVEQRFSDFQVLLSHQMQTINEYRNLTHCALEMSNIVFRWPTLGNLLDLVLQLVYTLLTGLDEQTDLTFDATQLHRKMLRSVLCDSIHRW